MEMNLGFEKREDLRLRMAELEKKLSESEEERCRLEKTCNVLMRAFKEEEKMRYKALNKKYEKFLEDCTVRKRRNDIILRSLCRIEDRSKVLFAKTERLKLLKDRYISYLKVNDINEEKFQPSRTLPPSLQKTSDVTSKLIQWKTPLASFNREEVHGKDLFSKNEGFHTKPMTFDTTSHDKGKRDKSEEFQRYESAVNERNGFNYLSRIEDVKSNGRDSFDLNESNVGLQEQLANIRSGELGDYGKKTENYFSKISNKCQEILEAAARREQGTVLSQQESIEKRRKSLLSEASYINNEDDKRYDLSDIVEKDRTERNEKKPVSQQNNAEDELISVINHNLVISSPITVIHEEGKQEVGTKNNENKRDSPEDYEEENGSSNALPKGLDGVDYENETYPESYYEQPAHHSHVSIASDVILEEDEPEEDEKDVKHAENFSETHLDQHGRSGWGIFNDPKMKMSDNNKQTDEANKGHHNEGVESQESEKSAESKQTSLGDEEAKSERIPPNKSNLIHLLESDSESFQIEHGDVVSGNEDSEFDFSFGQN